MEQRLPGSSSQVLVSYSHTGCTESAKSTARKASLPQTSAPDWSGQGNSVARYWFSCEQTWQIWVRLGEKGVDLGGSSTVSKSSVHLDDQRAK